MPTARVYNGLSLAAHTFAVLAHEATHAIFPTRRPYTLRAIKLRPPAAALVLQPGF